MTRPSTDLPFSLTPAQDLAVQLLLKTGSATQVALELGLSRETIYDQLNKARQRMGVPNLIRLVVVYMQHIHKEIE